MGVRTCARKQIRRSSATVVMLTLGLLTSVPAGAVLPSDVVIAEIKVRR